MKFQLKNIIAIMAISLAFVSCSKDDEAVSGVGKLTVEFDNVYKTANFAFSTNYTNSNNEVVSITQAKYIVSNIVLTKRDGTIFTVPKSESYFIVDEAIPTSTSLSLSNIPAGDYKSIKFGIGVDQAQWELGAEGQGDFLTQAQTAGMMWNWTGGYKFVNFEGSFTSSSVTTATNFQVHTGKTGTAYNYTDVTLNFPDNALVRTTITPTVHLFADLSKIIDGTNVINLSEQAAIMGGTKLTLVTENIRSMFSVNHVHND